MQRDCKLATVGLKETETPSKCRAKSEVLRAIPRVVKEDNSDGPQRGGDERKAYRVCRLVVLDSWMWRFRYWIQVHRPSCSVAAKVRDLPLPKLMRRLGSASQPRKFKYLIVENVHLSILSPLAVISWGRNYGSRLEDDNSNGGSRE